MTAGDAMRGLFKAIGEYVRSTSTPNAGRPPVLDVVNIPNQADAIVQGLERAEAQVAFRRHNDGIGFTIDGSRRPGDPTSPGDQNTGAFLGLQSGHALACLKAWADKAGMEFDESLGFEGNLTQWFIDQGNFREGR